MLARFANGHIRNSVDHPFEVSLTDGSDFSVRRGIAEVNRDRHAVAHGKFHRIQIIAEVLIQLCDSPLYLIEDFLGRLPFRLVTQVIGMTWIVRHDSHIGSINGITAEVHLEFHFLL